MAEAQAKHAGGRPTKYEPWMLRAAVKVAEWGATGEDIADVLGVAPSTVDEWLATDSEFSGSVKHAREWSDQAVVKSLRQRAMGYEKDGQHIPAHPTAQIFWLKNRDKERWRDKVETEHTGSVNVNHQSDPASIANQLVTLGTQFPTLNPVIRNLAQSILDRLPELPGA